MTKVKDEPRASVEDGCGVADGDGGAAEIGRTGSADKLIFFSSFHSISTMVSGEVFFVLSFRRPASAPARNSLVVKRSLSHQPVVNGSENTSEAPAIVSCISTGGTGYRLRRNCIVPPSRREVCWASDVESTSWASAAESFWWAYVVKFVSWDSENPANIMSSKPIFMCLVGLVSSFKDSSFNQSSLMECLPIQSFDVLCIALLALCCTPISSYYERSLTLKCQNINLNLMKLRILRNSVSLPYDKEYLFSTLKIDLFNISTVGLHSPSGNNP
ncbi:expressed protein [Arabidopsis lyrata subsp. lyrata]|uniref:Expressed protein n=1 Tax=Arabidopsis lyrata subsp. lyrata TaxID=81972 RepID=D7MAB8_ARALL|nr:expressed protein [Arabidopsis lyrata subsp. lyrata]